MTEVQVLDVGNLSTEHHGNYYRLKVDGVSHIIYWGSHDCTLRWDIEFRFNDLIPVLTKLHDDGYIDCTRDRMHLSEGY
jgi:hypothetical protein